METDPHFDWKFTVTSGIEVICCVRIYTDDQTQKKTKVVVSVFDYFVGLALKGLKFTDEILETEIPTGQYLNEGQQ